MNGKALLTSLPATTVEEMSEDVPSLTGGRRISLGESQVGSKRFAWCNFLLMSRLAPQLLLEDRLVLR